MQPTNKQLIPVITNDITKAELRGAVLNTVDTLKDTGGVLELADLVTKIDFYIKELKANKEFIELTRDEEIHAGEGELYVIYPPSKSSSSSFKTTLPKWLYATWLMTTAGRIVKSYTLQLVLRYTYCSGSLIW